MRCSIVNNLPGIPTITSNRFLIVLGTRPEAIKLAPVHAALRADSAARTFLLSTGQHREMLESALDAFQMVPDFDLALMKKGQTQPELVGAMLPGVARVIEDLRPTCVLVQGDTCSTFVGALAAFLHKIPVAHVEAGLRTGDRYSPFPEEMYRRLVTDLAEIHFAPTARARDHLLREGIDAARIHVTGNTAIDALHLVLRRDPQETSIARDAVLRELMETRYVLVTCHRRESFGEELSGIMRAIARLAIEHPDLKFVFPVHLNPEVRHTVSRLLQGIPNICLMDPLDYGAFAHVLQRSHLVLTDSGGIQEEAVELGRPVVVMRRFTERTEGLEAGSAVLAGVDEAQIHAAAAQLLDSPEAYRNVAVPSHVYGRGDAANHIARVLRERFG